MCRLLGCHGNGCTWYSAVLIISTVNYKVLMHDQLCHILEEEVEGSLVSSMHETGPEGHYTVKH